MADNRTNNTNRRPSNVLMAFNIVFFIIAIAVVVKIVVLQYFWDPNPKYAKHFLPAEKREIIEPERGSIIDHNGKLLAMSTPLYDVYMDCKIRKDEFRNAKDSLKGVEDEKAWQENAKALAQRLPEVLKEEKKTAGYYERLILDSREAERGGRYVPLAKGIEHETLLALKELPLFNEKLKYRNCMIVEKNDTRQYPYGDLARRVIGYVKHGTDSNRTVYHIGIEGKYDYILHGKSGLEWKRITDKNAMIKNVDSSVVNVENGLNIRTTLDINMQDIADRALRRNIAKEENIVGGCVVILDTETAAVRAMVNLKKTNKGDFAEVFNMAAGLPAEPGSVFKAVTLTTLLEDGHIELETRIPTNNGKIDDVPKIAQDNYIVNYEHRTKKTTISVVEGFEISSNYVFRRLVKDHYGEKPEEFINRLHEYNFGEAYDFDLNEAGSIAPYIPDPAGRTWTMSDLVSAAIGYSVRVTPLQVVTFYNAIANKGKMLKPYIVESTEYKDKIVEKFQPTLLNGAICSKATADTLTRALKMVTKEGTAKQLQHAKCSIAGKTGTSRMFLEPFEQAGSGKPYESINGEKKHQATFVGFFPADAPKYTAIVVVYTGLMKGNVYGGSIPATTFMEIADELWSYEEEWGQALKERGEVPQMKARSISTSKSADSPVPDLKGLGLKDAIFAIENNGYRCRYSGTGHVDSQTPESGSKLAKGQTINIVLK